MGKESKGSEVRSGFRLAGEVMLVFGWLFLVFAGLGEGFASGGAHRPVLGSGILAVAAAVLLWTMSRWIRAFPGLTGLATINALGAIFTGHATGNPSVRISSLEAAITSALLAVSTIVSLRLTRGNLRVLDRVAVFSFVFCVFWTAVDNRVQIIAPAVACGLLVAAWAYDRFFPQGRPNRRSSVTLRQFSDSR
jgi:hypothetical protein